MQDYSDVLNEIYYDPETGFCGANQISRIARAKGYNITKAQAAEWLAQQMPQQIAGYNPSAAAAHRHPIIGADGQYGIDLIFFDSQTAHFNRGYGVFLVCIEMLSRYAFVYPLKSKAAAEVAPTVEQFILDSIEIDNGVQAITCDNGSEFLNHQVRAILAKNEIELYLADSGDHHSTGILDRFVRTFREIITKYIIANGNKSFIGDLPELVKNYNGRINRTTTFAPNDAINDDETRERIRIKLNRKAEPAREHANTFKLGDTVRVLVPKNKFEKGLPKFSKELFKIVGREGFSFDVEPLEKNKKTESLAKSHYTASRLLKV